jgi:hypothetical protein
MAPLISTIRATLIGLGIALALALPSLGRAESDPATPEWLARTPFAEGVPYAEARALSDADVARLIEMLDDPDEARHRAQIIEVLGMSGGAGAYSAVSAAAAKQPTGEVDGATLRSRVAILVALGHLARSDDRALADLESAAAKGDAPEWSHRHLRDARLGGLLQRSAATALAISGRPRAESALVQLRADSGDSPELAKHLDAALDLRARVARDGPHATFGRGLVGGAGR